MWSRSASSSRYAVPFLSLYFFYYAGYCIFCSYIVSYLTESGNSATVCGIITSLALITNLFMEPFSGYITDTFLSTRRFLALSIGCIVLLCFICTFCSGIPIICLPLLVLTGGIAYSFSQLMDAWVNCSRTLDPDLIYSQVRAGGSIGYAIISVLAGCFFEAFGWRFYFLLQAVFFLLMLPALPHLPQVELGNRIHAKQELHHLSLKESFGILAKNHKFILCLLLCTIYWFSHRPVGSYLALIVEDRSGDASIFGSICGLGAVVEFLTLLFLAYLQRKKAIPLPVYIVDAVLINLARPVCVSLLPGIWPLYLGQAFQSVSFALFFTGSVECFTWTSDPRIRSFCISVGLTVSYVCGSILANLLGGHLCDLFGSSALVTLSLVSSIANTLILLFCYKPIFASA